MKRMLNTLYVTSEGAWLRKDGANLVVEVDGVEKGRAPLHMLEWVVGFGRPGASPALMAACAEAGIGAVVLRSEWTFSGAGGGGALGQRAAAAGAVSHGR